MGDYQEETLPQGESAPTGEGAGAPSDLQAELEAAKAQAEEFLRLLQRTKADFINYQRRSEQERAELERYAAAGVLLRLLPVIDDLERAVAALPNDLAGHPWAQGIVLIERKLKTTLEQIGLRPIEAVGQPFDPLQHEAVGREPVTPEQAGIVVAEVERGYRFHDRLLRPARVRVGQSAAEVRA